MQNSECENHNLLVKNRSDFCGKASTSITPIGELHLFKLETYCFFTLEIGRLVEDGKYWLILSLQDLQDLLKLLKTVFHLIDFAETVLSSE